MTRNIGSMTTTSKGQSSKISRFADSQTTARTPLDKRSNPDPEASRDELPRGILAVDVTLCVGYGLHLETVANGPWTKLNNSWQGCGDGAQKKIAESPENSTAQNDQKSKFPKSNMFCPKCREGLK